MNRTGRQTYRMLLLSKSDASQRKHLALVVLKTRPVVDNALANGVKVLYLAIAKACQQSLEPVDVLLPVVVVDPVVGSQLEQNLVICSAANSNDGWSAIGSGS